MTKLVIFDFDGLLVNSEFVVFSALQNIFKEYNSDFSWNYFINHLGMSVDESLQIFYRDLPIPISFNEFRNLRNKAVKDFLESQLQLMPGAYSLLNKIKMSGINMGLCSSGKKDYILQNLSKLDIYDFFETIVTIDDVSLGKPHPDIVLKVLEKSHVSPENAIMLDDAPNGIEAANKAGVFSIAIPIKGLSLERFTHAKIVAKNLETVSSFFSFFA